MSKHWKIWAIGILGCALCETWAQDSSTSMSGDATPTPQQQEPVPAYGQENAPPPISENPPISGLDTPSLEPHAAPLSYLQAGATFSESADSNVGNTLGGGGTFTSISRALGSLALKRLWNHSDLALDYVGGAGYYDIKGQGFKNLQQMDLEEKILWKRGQLSLRDSFSYLPEGNFGAAYGSEGSQGIASLGGTAFGAFWQGAALGTLGLVPRLLNLSLVDATENLTPKSAITAAGGYAFTHFYGNNVSTGGSYIASSQISGQVGYDRQLTSKTQVALVYGYQGFDFNVVGTAFHSHIAQVMYGHRISGRMDFLIGAGPQFTSIRLCPVFISGQCFTPIPDFRIGVAGRARLRYRFPKTNLDMSYERYETAGSGFFAGAQTDIARLTADRPLTRVWNGFVDLGYSRNSRLQSLSPAQLATCVYPGQPNPTNLPPCPGISAHNYEYGFAGVGVHRAFGHSFHGFASYQFNELYFDQSYCAGLPVCSRIGNRNVVTLGLDWTPRPIRLD